MSNGARSTEQWREHRALLEAIQRGGPVPDPAPPAPAAPPPPAVMAELDAPPPAPLERYGAMALGALALLWLAALVTGQQAEAAPVAAIATQISLASGPLALLGIAWLLLQRTSRREARRFGQTAAAMRAEAAALDAGVASLSARIDDGRKALAEHGQQLLALGEDAALRLSEIGATMRHETASLTRQSDVLESAAGNALSDMGVLISDLPRIEAQVHTLATSMRGIGHDADERVNALSTVLATLADRAREVDEVAGGAAQRLSAHLARIESISDAAGSRIDSAADGIARTVDTALTSAADAVDATRASIEAQSEALLAMVEQSKAALARAGGDAAESLHTRLADASAYVDGIGEKLTAHDADARGLLTMLTDRVGELDRALADAGASGAASADRLAERLHAIGGEAEAIGGAIARGSEAADALVARGAQLRALGEELPAMLGAIEQEAARGGAAIETLLPRTQALAAGVAEASRAIAAIDATLSSQRGALTGIGADAGAQLAELEERARAVDAMLAQAGERAATLAGSAGPQLVEALLRVRETATQAADHAGRAFAEVIQQAAARLAEQSRAALDAQLDASVEDKLAAIATASDRAATTAQEAARRLTDEMATIATTADALEKSLEQARARGETTPGDGISSRVAQLIEQLNSTGIDVARLMAVDMPDTLWSAYLKGDRGIFTRRAAKLVESGEAKEIARHYEQDTPFRDQVNRYIHDFEAMLRHILAMRDGSLLGVTLLSSDMGKLYVALAQAIERLRA